MTTATIKHVTSDSSDGSDKIDCACVCHGTEGVRARSCKHCRAKWQPAAETNQLPVGDEELDRIKLHSILDAHAEIYGISSVRQVSGKMSEEERIKLQRESDLKTEAALLAWRDAYTATKVEQGQRELMMKLMGWLPIPGHLPDADEQALNELLGRVLNAKYEKLKQAALHQPDNQGATDEKTQ